MALFGSTPNYNKEFSVITTKSKEQICLTDEDSKDLVRATITKAEN